MEPELTSDSVIDTNAPYCRVRDIRAEKMDDNLFLIDQLKLTIDMLDPIGALIWELLAEPICISEVTDLIAAVFPDADQKQIQFDVYSLFQKFGHNEWIMVNSAIK